MPLEVCYTAPGNGPVNAEVMKHIDDIQLKEMNDRMLGLLAANDRKSALHVAHQIEEKARSMGQGRAKKTMLVREVIDDLTAGKPIPKKTQLAVEDAMRSGERA